MLRLATLCAALCALAVAFPAAASAKSCSAPKYPGSGYFTSLSVKNTTCKKGRELALAHYHCRTKHGKKGRCANVLGYHCTEKRQSIPTELDSRVTCKRGAKRVVFTYQQNL
ncbi:MAG: hypothetical protein QOI80_3491 [Solirubrobacteraceae bacterium]|jgi:hypothetical protein|nr:hypothetical protein [Solirubrobacteraceae bacterium]